MKRIRRYLLNRPSELFCCHLSLDETPTVFQVFAKFTYLSIDITWGSDYDEYGFKAEYSSSRMPPSCMIRAAVLVTDPSTTSDDISIMVGSMTLSVFRLLP